MLWHPTFEREAPGASNFDRPVCAASRVAERPPDRPLVLTLQSICRLGAHRLRISRRRQAHAVELAIADRQERFERAEARREAVAGADERLRVATDAGDGSAIDTGGHPARLDEIDEL